MSLTDFEIAQKIDLSAVRANDDETSIRALVAAVRQFHCCLVSILPSQTLFVKTLQQKNASGPAFLIGGNVGFPSGGQSTRIKSSETRELVHLGCSEIDMVLNIAWLLSGRDDYVLQDILGVVDTAKEIVPGTLVKVILECHYLTPDQIRRGCDLSIDAGADFVNTSTGWTATGATLDNIGLIKAHVGDAIRIKASGGIRTKETLLAMHQLGVTRFGIGARWLNQIFNNEKA
jgi:deoxyribose-phosphate aldolase